MLRGALQARGIRVQRRRVSDSTCMRRVDPASVSLRHTVRITTGHTQQLDQMHYGGWKVAYQNVFDGGSLLTPLVSSDIDMSVRPTIGTIISHRYLACGFIPVRIAFPSLAAILLIAPCMSSFVN